MEIALPLLIGLCSSAGILVPGLLNMTAAKISLCEGRQRAIFFALGATTVVFIQSYIAISFAKFLNRRPDVIELLEEVGLGIFTLLTLYFFFIAKKPEIKTDVDVTSLKSRTGEFFLGVLLSALNFFPVPYYAFVSISLSAYGYFLFSNQYIFLFVIGAIAGTFGIFYLYIVFFRRFQHKAGFFMKYANYFIGAVTGLVSVITLLRIMKKI